MNCRTIACLWRNLASRINRVWIIGVLSVFGLVTSARADVNVEAKIWRVYDFSYYLSVTMTVSNATPITYYRVESPTGKAWMNRGSTNNSIGWVTNDLSAILGECNTGLWKLYVNVGDVSETLYQFKVSVTGVQSNLLGDVEVLYPNYNQTVPPQPTFHFTGPSNLPSLYVRAGLMGAFLSSSVTNWTPPNPLPAGANDLYVEYYSNNFPGFSFTAATNGAGMSVPGWSAQGTLAAYAYESFFVGTMGEGHTLRAHYTFEDNDIRATDYSGNGNDITSLGSAGTGGQRYTTNNPTIGNHAAYFNNNGGAGSGFLIGPDELLPTLAGSFTISLWVQTTQVSGDDDDAGFSNAGLVSAFNGGSDWVLPMAITGSKLGFATGGFPNDTLNSSASITNGSDLVHLVVTRNQSTGEKKIYVNGDLDATGTGATDLLDSPTTVFIGYNNGNGFMGVMDDIQIYSGVLSAAEVLFLYENPGSTVPNTGGSPLGEAVEAPQLAWTTGGDAEWFPQTDESNDGIDAAQSGAIDHNQESWIETTVQGPGWFSFYWNVSSDDFDGYDYLEFTVDGFYESEISGEWGWDWYDVYLDEGMHTLRWTYYKDGDFTAGVDAAWLDEVTFQPEIEVDLTLTIERNTDPNNPGFYAYPSINNVYPTPLTTCEVESPSGMFSAWTDGSQGGSGFSTLSTLQEAIDELETGSWRLYINRGHPSEIIYTFDVTVNTLSLADLAPVNITAPTEWQTGLATNHLFTWTGPTGYDSVFLYSYVLETGSASGGFINLAGTATSTLMPNALLPGTNGVYINYLQSGFSGVEISDPVDGGFNNLSSWSSSVELRSVQTRRFVVGNAAPATPVQILNPAMTGNDFSFSFLTQDGRSHTVQSRTNLTTAPWINVTNFTGDGNVWMLTFPLGGEPENYFRVGTQ